MALSPLAAHRTQRFISRLYPRILSTRFSGAPQCGSGKICYSTSISIENSSLTQSGTLISHRNILRVQNLGASLQYNLAAWWDQLSTWLIKRTFQPSIIRKRRKTGFLTRQKTVGGRRVLARRKQKGRLRLGGC